MLKNVYMLLIYMYLYTFKIGDSLDYSHHPTMVCSKQAHLVMKYYSRL